MLTKSYSKTKAVCKVTFTVPVEAAPNAQEVKILGDFNNWSWEKGELLKRKDGQYTAVLELEAGKTYEFRYLADNMLWFNDYEADHYFSSPFVGIDNSVLIIDPVVVTEKAPAKSKVVKEKAPAKPKAEKATKVVADDLKKIEGIGPKIEKLFNAAGLTTFEAVATAPVATLQAILAEAGPRFKMHDPATWTKQARLAADGAWGKLEKLQDELKGGKA